MEYSTQKKNELFQTIQDLVNNKQLTAQNMVDLHDILIIEKPSYSHNKSGTLYMSSNYGDETCQNIEEFLNWVKRQHDNRNNRNNHTEQTSIEGMHKLIIEPTPISDQPKIQEQFGKHKLYKTSMFGDDTKYRFTKPEDVTKKSEVFKRIVKKSKKTSQIPIHYQEKKMSSFASSFNNGTRHRLFQMSIANEEGSCDDDDDDDDEKLIDNDSGEEDTEMRDSDDEVFDFLDEDIEDNFDASDDE